MIRVIKHAPPPPNVVNVPACGRAEQLMSELKMVFSDYMKKRIIFYYHKGFKPPTICSRLSQEGINTSRCGVSKFLKYYKLFGSIARRPGSGRSCKITDEVKKLVEEKMQQDDETIAMQLHQLLAVHGHTTCISKRTILRCRSALGWAF